MHLLNFLTSLSTPACKHTAIAASLSLVWKSPVLLFPSTLCWMLLPLNRPDSPMSFPLYLLALVSYSNVMHITVIFKKKKNKNDYSPFNGSSPVDATPSLHFISDFLRKEVCTICLHFLNTHSLSLPSVIQFLLSTLETAKVNKDQVHEHLLFLPFLFSLWHLALWPLPFWKLCFLDVLLFLSDSDSCVFLQWLLFSCLSLSICFTWISNVPNESLPTLGSPGVESGTTWLALADETSVNMKSAESWQGLVSWHLPSWNTPQKLPCLLDD